MNVPKILDKCPKWLLSTGSGVGIFLMWTTVALATGATPDPGATPGDLTVGAQDAIPTLGASATGAYIIHLLLGMIQSERKRADDREASFAIREAAAAQRESEEKDKLRQQTQFWSDKYTELSKGLIEDTRKQALAQHRIRRPK